MTTEYEAITESEWKDLATTEITHLTDEEKDYLPAAWDEWLARVKHDAAREALDGLADEAIHVNWPMDGPSFALRVRRFKNRKYPYRDNPYKEDPR